MADFAVFLLGFIPALAFATHSFVDYRKAAGKHVGEALVLFNRALAVMVVIEIILFAWLFFARL
ncbi:MULTISPECIES: hypothetical protein [unclassified Pseudomonas]|jgi:hypothetical protein|uniref:hypothetical protein n=1 Tax=Pseudomonas sp. A-R-26 TaxID=2832404 RepID=UPI001CBFBB4C|nr:hypothetical protein [Pseudomonas sp. A-R-26]